VAAARPGFDARLGEIERAVRAHRSNGPTKPASAPVETAAPVARAAPISNAGAQAKSELRVFLTDRKSWQASGGLARSTPTGAASEQGELPPAKDEFLKAFREHCPAVKVTMRLEKADYVVTLDQSTWHSPPYRVAVFSREGDVTHSGATQLLGNAVKEACNAITERR